MVAPLAPTLTILPGPIAPPDPHAYWKKVKARPDCFRAQAWRTQEEIDQFARQVQNPKTITYDSSADAALMLTPPGGPNGLPNGPITELAMATGPNNDKNLFGFCDYRWGAEWAFSQAGVAAHKGAPWAFCSPTDSLWVATRVSYLLAQQHTFNQPAGGPFLAFTWAQGAASEAIKTSLDDPDSPWWVGDMAGFPLVKLPDNDLAHSRKYGEAVAPVVHNATFPGGTELGIVAKRWTRFFHFLERAPDEDWISNRGRFAGKNQPMEAYRWYHWLADTERDPILMIDGAIVSPNTTVPKRWAEVKSEFQGGAGTPNISTVPLPIHTRNWAVTHGTSKDEVLGLLEKPLAA